MRELLSEYDKMPEIMTIELLFKYSTGVMDRTWTIFLNDFLTESSFVKLHPRRISEGVYNNIIC